MGNEKPLGAVALMEFKFSIGDKVRFKRSSPLDGVIIKQKSFMGTPRYQCDFGPGNEEESQVYDIIQEDNLELLAPPKPKFTGKCPICQTECGGVCFGKW